jgi:hypothetical protein
MELDGYCNDLKIAFEHQGQQHYKKIEHFNRRNESLDLRKQYDAEKRYLCKINKVILIEIPYFIPVENLKDWILNALIVDCKFSLIKNIEEVTSKNYVPSNELNDLKKISLQHGGECLDLFYKGVFEKHKFSCKKGHVWFATPNNVKTGSWCPKCKPERIGDSNRKHSLVSMNDLARIKHGKFLSQEFKSVNDKYEWECSSNHRWFATPSDVAKGSWCKICSVLSKKGTIEQMIEIAHQRGGECLSNKYVNSQTHLKWRCKSGHTWMARPDNVKNSGSWCPFCAVASK